MASRISWDKYETAILIDTYVKIKRNILSRYKAIKYLSKILRDRAIKLDIEIDDTFRNENGIDMRLHEIGFLFGDESEIKNTSYLFRNMVDMYKNNQEKYLAVLEEANQITLCDTQANLKSKKTEDILSYEAGEELIEYLNEFDIKVIDNRAYDERILVVFDPHSKLLIEKLKNDGYNFKYRYDQSREVGSKSIWWIKAKKTSLIKEIREDKNYNDTKKIVEGYYLEELHPKEELLESPSIKAEEALTFEEAEFLISAMISKNIAYSDDREKESKLWIFDGIEAGRLIDKLRKNNIALHYKYRINAKTRNKGTWWIAAEQTPYSNVKILKEKNIECGRLLFLKDDEPMPATNEVDVSVESVSKTNRGEVYAEPMLAADEVDVSVESVSKTNRGEVYAESMPVANEVDVSAESVSKANRGEVYAEPMPVANEVDVSAESVSKTNRGEVYAEPISATNEIEVSAEILHEDDKIKNANYDSSLNLAKMFGLNSSDYALISTDALPFSVRALNCFRKYGINTLEDLLNKTEEELLAMQSLGKGTMSEIKKILNGKVVKEIASSKDSIISMINGLTKRKNRNRYDSLTFKTNENVPMIFRINIGWIINGEWSEFNKFNLNTEEKNFLKRIVDGYNILGSELVYDCFYHGIEIDQMKKHILEYRQLKSKKKDIENLVKQLEPYKRTNRVRGYLMAYGASNDIKNIILSFYSSEEDSLESCLDSDNLYSDLNVEILEKFLVWCNFKISDSVEKVKELLLDHEKNIIVLKGRYRKKTLEELGNIIGVTRERIRQIEAKLIRKFTALNRNLRILHKIYADRNCDSVLTIDELSEYFGEYSEEICYLLEKVYHTQFTYDSSLDVFIYNGDSLYEQTMEYIENLPSMVNVKNLNKIFNEASDNGIQEELFEKIFYENYTLTGDVYHRERITRNDLYKMVLKKYFPKGIRVYNPKIMKEFRNHIFEEFGDVNLPTNDRAIYGRIADLCILCDRGCYKLKEKTYISKELEEKIHKHILKDKKDIILDNTIFYTFRQELLKEGVDNKYYLHGILHELFDQEFYFRRDYISKVPISTESNDVGTSSALYSVIKDFIKTSKVPVTKKQIYDEFPGLTEIVLSFAVDDYKILNYFGSYLDSSYLKLEKYEKDLLKKTIDEMLSDDKAHHVKEIYEKFNNIMPEVFTRNGAMNHFCAYSIIKYLFINDYDFLRPYISKLDVEIERPSQRLHEMMSKKMNMSIGEIREFAKENYLQIYSMLDFLNSCNDEFLILDNDNIIKYDAAGIEENIALKVESIVYEAVTRTIPIRDLNIWANLPTINVQWTDWLIYSVIKKWSNRLSVSVSDSQIKKAVPLISLLGDMDESLYKGIRPDDNAEPTAIDDMDNIDDLLGDILSDMWEENI